MSQMCQVHFNMEFVDEEHAQLLLIYMSENSKKRSFFAMNHGGGSEDQDLCVLLVFTTIFHLSNALSHI